jgi:hypothetical protein
MQFLACLSYLSSHSFEFLRSSSTQIFQRTFQMFVVHDFPPKSERTFHAHKDQTAISLSCTFAYTFNDIFMLLYLVHII